MYARHNKVNFKGDLVLINCWSGLLERLIMIKTRKKLIYTTNWYFQNIQFCHAVQGGTS